MAGVPVVIELLILLAAAGFLLGAYLVSPGLAVMVVCGYLVWLLQQYEGAEQ